MSGWATLGWQRLEQTLNGCREHGLCLANYVKLPCGSAADALRVFRQRRANGPGDSTVRYPGGEGTPLAAARADVERLPRARPVFGELCEAALWQLQRMPSGYSDSGGPMVLVIQLSDIRAGKALRWQRLGQTLNGCREHGLCLANYVKLPCGSAADALRVFRQRRANGPGDSTVRYPGGEGTRLAAARAEAERLPRARPVFGEL